MNQRLRGGDIGGHRDVVDIAQPQQTGLVGFSGLCGNGIAEKEQEVDFVTGYTRRNLLIAALESAEELEDAKPGGIGHLFTGPAGRAEVVPA